MKIKHPFNIFSADKIVFYVGCVCIEQAANNMDRGFLTYNAGADRGLRQPGFYVTWLTGPQSGCTCILGL